MPLISLKLLIPTNFIIIPLGLSQMSQLDNKASQNIIDNTFNSIYRLKETPTS